ncbi:MAG TPA: hypothetical protein VG892_07790 [Terriglobales bacterium]|nr:hypothetical protein [Terriglobales bacterium]
MSGAGINPLAIYDPELYAKSLKIQQRQALAQSLLQSGSQNPGSAPYAGLRNAGNSILGAYLAKSATNDMGNLYAQPDPGQISNNSGSGPVLAPSSPPPQPQAPGQAPPQAQPPQAAQIMGQGQKPAPAPSQAPQQGQEAPPPDYAALPAHLQRLYDRIPHFPGMPAQQAVNFFMTNPAGYQAAWAKQFEPTPPQPFTLSPGQQRFDAFGKPIAALPQQESRILTPQEIQARGLPAPPQGSLYQLSPTNQLSVVKTTDVMSPDRFKQEASLAQTKADITANTGLGRSMMGHAYNILAQGLKNPALINTPEYYTAWQILSNPQIDPNTGTVVVPDLSAFRPPPGVVAHGKPSQRMPAIKGFAPPNPSQPEAASAGFANRLAESSKIIDQTQTAGTSLQNRLKSEVPVVGNYLVGPEYQKLDQAERNFVNAQLRRESGAVISEEEFANARRQYFPQPGDSPQVLAQKKAARDMAVRNMQLSAGNVLLPPNVMQDASPPKGAPVVPQAQGYGAAPTSAPSATPQVRVRKYNPTTGRIE